MLGSSQKITAIREYLTQVAGFDSNVLITGKPEPERNWPRR